MKTSKVELYINGVLQTSHPIYPENISIEKVREDGEMFRRTKLNSTFTFVRDDFDTIYNSSMDTEFMVKVLDARTNIELARGTFEKSDCKFDMDNRICIVKTSSADEYDKILAGMNDEFDLVALAPVRDKIHLTKRAILQIYVMHDTKVTNIIGNMSYEVNVASGIDTDNITVQQLQDRYNFSPIGTGQSEVIVSAMPSGYSALLGTYVGSFIGENTVFRQQGGNYTIVVGKEYDDEQLDYFYFWEFKDGNGTVVTIQSDYGRVEPITTKPLWQNVPSPVYWGMQFGYNKEDGDLWVWHEDDRMVAAYDEKNTYGRIIMDATPQYPSGKVKMIEAEDFCENNLNYRFSMTTQGLTGLANNIVSSNLVQDEPTKWGVNGLGKYYVRPNPIHTGDNVIPIGWNRWIPYSLWFNSTEALADALDLYDVEWSLNDAYPLWSAIKVLLAKIDPSLSFEGTSDYSQFLYGTISSSVILGWVKQLLYISPITNIKKTYYNQAARKGKITLKQILDMLRNTCQLYWFIDNQKRLRLEHITWFKNGGNYAQQNPLIDLTSVESFKSRKKWSFGTDAFSYDKYAFTKRYEFSWNEECSEVFDGYPIDIRNKYASKGNTEKSQVANFISDIDLIISAPDVLGDDSFALIGVDDSKKCPIQSIGNFGMDFIAPTYKMQNPYFSFYYLEMAYWGYDLGGDWASIGDFKTQIGQQGVFRVFDTKRAKKQTVYFPIKASDVGKEGLVVTGIDTGEWAKAKYSPEDGMTEMELVMATRDDSLVSMGEFVSIGVTLERHVNGFVLNGNNQNDGYGYVRVTANKNVVVTMQSYSEENFDWGWQHTSPLITNSDVSSYATHKVAGQGETISFHMEAGTSAFFGYEKDSSQSVSGDMIIVTFVEE